jgi:hypothetical protein
MRTLPYDTTPNNSTTAGSVSLETDFTPYASVSCPAVVISTSTINEVEMKANSDLNMEEALEKFKVR